MRIIKNLIIQKTPWTKSTDTSEKHIHTGCGVHFLGNRFKFFMNEAMHYAGGKIERHERVTITKSPPIMRTIDNEREVEDVMKKLDSL